MHARPEDPAFLAQLSAELMADESVDVTVATVLERARDVVPEAEEVSLTLSRRRGFVTLGATSEAARVVDEQQYALREGPCVDAAESAEWVRSGDVGHDPRWPRWGPRAARVGFESMLSVPLAGANSSVGALNLYGRGQDRFADRDAVDFALVYSVHAANALKSAHLATGLRTALDTRHTIGVAQGILMERYDISGRRAFELLTRYSSHLNRKLADVAAFVVQERRLPDGVAELQTSAVKADMWGHLSAGGDGGSDTETAGG